ncbi:hypothetical protein C3L33_00936, partial [Rhododendron williamsianum]
MEFSSSANPVCETCFETKFHRRQLPTHPFAGVKFVLYFVVLFMIFSNGEAYDPLDPFGNITIKWDVMSWTPDGYVEVIWSMVGAQATEQGDCSKFKGNVPHCCLRSPTIVDLLPGVPYNQQFSNCCKGGVVASWGQDPAAAVSAFQVSVGVAGTSNKTVQLPKNFTLLGPGPGYTCGPAKIVPSTVFLTADRRRKTQALNDTGMFYGMKFYNDLLMEAGPAGNVQSEVLLQKNKETFTLKQGWAFPRKVYFNGDECKLPPPDAYPVLPNSARANPAGFLTLATSALLLILSIC